MFGKRAGRHAQLKDLPSKRQFPTENGIVRSEIYHIIDVLREWQATVAPADSVRWVVVENQFKGEMRVVQAVLAMLYGNKVVFLQPAVVRKHFGLDKVKSYATRKCAATRRASELVAALPDGAELSKTLASGKVDDLADALMQALFWADQCESGAAELPAKPARKKRAAAKARTSTSDSAKASKSKAPRAKATKAKAAATKAKVVIAAETVAAEQTEGSKRKGRYPPVTSTPLALHLAAARAARVSSAATAKL
eukprot:c54340_g1_i1.p1 GENE.c54340_g1_i1~~c54340_g1_i1.p1  ORF type:complete len:283 (-),score=54.86 c54340_g1_i1:28-786(-)